MAFVESTKVQKQKNSKAKKELVQLFPEASHHGNNQQQCNCQIVGSTSTKDLLCFFCTCLGGPLFFDFVFVFNFFLSPRNASHVRICILLNKLFRATFNIYLLACQTLGGISKLIKLVQWDALRLSSQYS